MVLKNLILILFAGSSFLTYSIKNEFSRPKVIDESKPSAFFDPSAYYELNETKAFTNFEVKWLIDLMEEYPNLKIKFVQTITKQESLELAENRMINFEKSLKQGNVEMSRIAFEPTVYYLDETESDQRSRIQGVVILLD